jgi:hypothetical protein
MVQWFVVKGDFLRLEILIISMADSEAALEPLREGIAGALKTIS